LKPRINVPDLEEVLQEVLDTLGSLCAQSYLNYRGAVNTASFAPQGPSAGGIARGSIFTLFGRGLGPTEPARPSAFPLGEALGGVSIEVKQDSVSLTAYPVYASDSQVSAIMPSKAPLGRVALHLTYNGQTVGPAIVDVVESSLGIFAVNSGGFGPGVLQNFISQSVSPVNSTRVTARPGQTMILWGTGLGAVSYADNVAPIAGDFPTEVEIFVGGTLATRRYAGRSPCWGPLCQSIAQQIAGEAILDGEIVCLDDDGRPQFYDLMRRREPQCFYAFDLLWLDGRDFRGLPLLERKAQLRDLVGEPGIVRYVEHFASGTALFREVCERDMEGIVAKLARAPYDQAEPSWVKMKNPDYSQMQGRWDLFELRANSTRAWHE
jgi:uncharacterized protein (TIGR03437 family)